MALHAIESIRSVVSVITTRKDRLFSCLCSWQRHVASSLPSFENVAVDWLNGSYFCENILIIAAGTRECLRKTNLEKRDCLSKPYSEYRTLASIACLTF